jgi:hypothetical protein
MELCHTIEFLLNGFCFSIEVVSNGSSQQGCNYSAADKGLEEVFHG